MHELLHSSGLSCQLRFEHSPALPPAKHSYGLSMVHPSGGIHRHSGKPDSCSFSAFRTILMSGSFGAEGSWHSQ